MSLVRWHNTWGLVASSFFCLWFQFEKKSLFAFFKLLPLIQITNKSWPFLGLDKLKISQTHQRNWTDTQQTCYGQKFNHKPLIRGHRVGRLFPWRLEAVQESLMGRSTPPPQPPKGFLGFCEHPESRRQFPKELTGPNRRPAGLCCGAREGKTRRSAPTTTSCWNAYLPQSQGSMLGRGVRTLGHAGATYGMAKMTDFWSGAITLARHIAHRKLEEFWGSSF